MWSVTKLALRAAVWRTTPEPRLGGLPALLLALVVLAAVRVAFELLAAGPGWAFNPYGLNAVVAWIALEVAVAALFVQPGARMAALTAMFMLSVVAEIVLHAAEIAAPLLPPVDLARFGVTWSGPVAPFAILGVVSIWWIGAVIAVLRSLGAQAWFAVLGRAVGIWLALLAVSALVPHAPVFVARDFDIRTANLWESARVRLMAAADNTGTAKSAPAPQEHAQRALLQAQIAKLAPPVKGKTNLYAVGIAGWSGQDVFLKELDGGLAALGEILPIGGHTLRLVNSSETRETLPLADPRNFVAAIHAAAGLMNKNDDVLVLLMTSHGDAVRFWSAIAERNGDRTDTGHSRGGSGAGRHQKPPCHRVGLLRRNFRTAAGKRRHHRAHRRGRQKYLVRLRGRARLDLFRRRPVPAKPQARPGPPAGLRQRQVPDTWLGVDGPGDAVQSAGPLRSGFGRAARSVFCCALRHGPLTGEARNGPTFTPGRQRHATCLTRRQFLSDAHRRRSSRKRSTGAAD